MDLHPGIDAAPALAKVNGVANALSAHVLGGHLASVFRAPGLPDAILAPVMRIPCAASDGRRHSVRNLYPAQILET